MNGAYRSTRIQPLCGECGELADGSCPRCGRPLCSAHAPAPERRCAACEEQYEVGTVEILHRSSLDLLRCGALLAPLALSFVGLGYLLWLEPVPMLLFGGLPLVFAPMLMGQDLELQRKWRRRRFLAERARVSQS
jgi:hypothetical protein